MMSDRVYSEKEILRPTPPFDFAQSLDFMRSFGPIQDSQVIDKHSFTRAISIQGQVVAFRVLSHGDTEKPELECKLVSDEPISSGVKARALERVESFLGLHDDLRPFYEIGYTDPDFAPVIERLYGYHQVRFLTPFECACWAILSQRNTMTIALRLKQRLVVEFGGTLETDQVTFWAFPEPARVAVVDTGYIATFIRNGRRAEYLVDVAQAFAEADEDFLRSARYDRAEAWLKGIKGIGDWSARFILLRGLGRTERIPWGEKRLIEAAPQVYGRGYSMAFEDIQRIADGYGQYQGYWAHYLRVASDLSKRAGATPE